MPPVVIRKDNRYYAVKNLGWLRRHWKEVDYIEVRKPEPIGQFYNQARMFVWCKEGSPFKRYEADWASSMLLRQWLHRPVFRGVRLVWFGQETEC